MMVIQLQYFTVNIIYSYITGDNATQLHYPDYPVSERTGSGTRPTMQLHATAGIKQHAVLLARISVGFTPGYNIQYIQSALEVQSLSDGQSGPPLTGPKKTKTPGLDKNLVLLPC